MKTYVLTLSEFFPSTHIRKGEPTHFRDAFNAGQVFNRGSECLYRHPKKHTIRANYPLWENRIAEIQQGKAVLSIRQWTGKPYRSKQVEIASLTADDGVGIQKLSFSREMLSFEIDDKGFAIPESLLAENDGLSLEDWIDWFKGYDLDKPMAIIHFTKFRY